MFTVRTNFTTFLVILLGVVLEQCFRLRFNHQLYRQKSITGNVPVCLVPVRLFIKLGLILPNELKDTRTIR